MTRVTIELRTGSAIEVVMSDGNAQHLVEQWHRLIFPRRIHGRTTAGEVCVRRFQVVGISTERIPSN